MKIQVDGFHIPGFQGQTYKRTIGSTQVLLPKLTADDISRANDHLLGKGREILKGYSTDDLAEIFGMAADFWQQDSDLKMEIVVAISDLTGLSRMVVCHSISVEQGNSSTKDILAAMDRDLGSHRCLNAFQHDPHLNGMAKAYGPRLTSAVLTANVPGLSYLPMVRSLMVKSPLIAKLASNEPVFGPAWIKSVTDIEPPLAECVALCHWQSGNDALQQAMFDPAEVAILYGGEQTCRTLREFIGPHKKIIEHGHKIGLLLIDQEGLSDLGQARDLASRIALDVAMFDQRACVAPQIVYVERNGTVSTLEFTALIEEALIDLEKDYPPSAMSIDTGASLAMERNIALFEAAQHEDVELFARSTATLIHEKDAHFKTVLPTRFLRVCPVDDLDEVIAILRPFSSYLQNIGIESNPERIADLAEQLGAIGVSRITRPGLMHRPTMRWKHDGISTFSDLVRWTDIELEV
ncbi:MAG: acyl-CoA reductase [Thermodesulfobacteriota bacterium]